MSFRLPHNVSPSSLTRPPSFQARPAAVSHLGSAASLYAEHDRALLGHQVRLVDRVVEGTLDRETFMRHVTHLEGFETLRAELRGDGGLTRSERALLQQEMKKLAGKMHALPIHQSEPRRPIDREALGQLYDELSQGVVSKGEAVDELAWRAQKLYGETVTERSGVVYADERPKLRAALHRPLPLDATSVRPPAASERSIHPGTRDLVRQAIAIFPQLDRDHNGLVDRKEARTLLTEYQKLGLSSAEAAALYSRQAIIAEVDSPGPASHEMMALEDLQGMLPENAGLVDPQRADAALQMLSSRLADQQRRSVHHPMPLALRGTPDGHQVSQGLEGSCWFLGALPTLSSDQIQETLVPEGEQYRMFFADGTNELVSPLNDAERRVYSRGDGTWSGLMEKGLAQKLEKEGRDIKGGLTQEALKVLTGADCEVLFLHARPPGGEVDYRDRQRLGERIQATLEAGRALFTQTNSQDFDPHISLVSQSQHAYTIIGYDPSTETARLRNPWGHGEKADRDGVDDGNFDLSLTELFATFSLVIAEKAPEAAPASGA